MKLFNVFNCAECGKQLSSLEIKHGWKSFLISWSAGSARVHTLCLEAFKKRSRDDQLRKRNEAP